MCTVPAVADIRDASIEAGPLPFDTQLAPVDGWTTLSVGTEKGAYTSTTALDVAVTSLNTSNITTTPLAARRSHAFDQPLFEINFVFRAGQSGIQFWGADQK